MDGSPGDHPALTWAGHSTVLIELAGVRILTDPVLLRRVGPLRRVSAPVERSVSARLDAVLLSHLHADHVSLPSLRLIPSDTRVIAPRGSGSWLARRGVRNVEEISAGEETDVGRLRIRATPANHDGRRRIGGVRAEPLGFLLHGGPSVYFAGDTDLFAQMSELSGSIDVALLPVSGWGPALGPGHLDPDRAVDAALRIEPRLAVPIHWGTLALPRALGGVGAPDSPARLFAAQMGRRAPGVGVRVLAPGDRLELNPENLGGDASG